MIRPADPASGSFRKALGRQARVVAALTMRDIHMRYGRRNLGFLWVMFEPILFAAGVIGLRSAVPYGHSEHGVPLVPFLMTGYLPFMFFRNIWSRAMHCVRENHNVLYHRQVSLLDLYFSRFGLEIAGVVLAIACSWTALCVVGLMRPPADLPLLYAGFLYLIWFSAVFSMLFSVGAELHSVIEKISHPVSYLSIIISGCFFMVDWLPPDFREIALYNPVVNCFEMIRGGYFGDSVTVHYDKGYLTGACLLLTPLALWSVMSVRKWISVE